MTTAKHTPRTSASWQVGRAHGSKWDDAICDGPIILARVLSTGYPLGLGGGKGKNDAKTARLIAAAPDLARALLAAFPILTRLAEQQRQARPSGLMEGPECNTAEYLVYLEARAALKAAGVES